VRERLNAASSKIEMFDMVELGRNPARIIPAVERMLARHEGRHLHYVGEPIWPGRTEDEIREATKREALPSSSATRRATRTLVGVSG